MKDVAWYLNGYEQHEGELELRPDMLLFNRKKGGRAGTFAAFGVVGLLLTSPYEPFMAIHRAEIQGAYPSPTNPNEFAVYTARGILVFTVHNRAPWLQAIGLLPASGPAPG